MTYHKGLSDERKVFLREYHNNYNKKYYQSSDSMKKSKVLYDFKRRYVLPPQILDTFGNNIPYLPYTHHGKEMKEEQKYTRRYSG